jgi:hypothetical protein
MPTGRMRVLICQWEMDSSVFDDDLGERDERNNVAKGVVRELACEETLKKALEEACMLGENADEASVRW